MARTSSSTSERTVLVHKDGRTRVVETAAQRVKAEHDGFRVATPKQAEQAARASGAVAPKQQDKPAS